MKKIIFEASEHVLKDFEIFSQKQRGEGPQASLALAKGGPQGNFKKLKKCFKAFETFKISSKTISFMKKIIFEASEHVLKDFEIFSQKKRGDHRRHLQLQRGDHREILKN